MLGKALMHIWDRKLEMKKIDREVRLLELAHQQAHNKTMAFLGNVRVASGNCLQYSKHYCLEFELACHSLGVYESKK